MVEDVRGLRSTKRQLQNRQGDVKYSIGNGVAKELYHDPWTETMVQKLHEGVGSVAWRGAMGKIETTVKT